MIFVKYLLNPADRKRLNHRLRHLIALKVILTIVTVKMIKGVRKGWQGRAMALP